MERMKIPPFQANSLQFSNSYMERLPKWMSSFTLDSEGKWVEVLEARYGAVLDEVSNQNQNQNQNQKQSTLSTNSVADLLPRAKPDSLAYVVMSSGTTGAPKGICCPHRGAVHSYYWRIQNFPFKELVADFAAKCNIKRDQNEAFSRFSYDIETALDTIQKDDEVERVACHVFFVWELFRPLLCNQHLFVIPDDKIYDPYALVDYLEEHRINRTIFI